MNLNQTANDSKGGGKQFFHKPRLNSTPTSMSRAIEFPASVKWISPFPKTREQTSIKRHMWSRKGIAMAREDADIPIFTTLENCTDFSAAFWRSSIENIFNPDSLIFKPQEFR